MGAFIHTVFQWVWRHCASFAIPSARSAVVGKIKFDFLINTTMFWIKPTQMCSIITSVHNMNIYDQYSSPLTYYDIFKRNKHNHRMYIHHIIHFATTNWDGSQLLRSFKVKFIESRYHKTLHVKWPTHAQFYWRNIIDINSLTKDFCINTATTRSITLYNVEKLTIKLIVYGGLYTHGFPIGNDVTVLALLSRRHVRHMARCSIIAWWGKSNLIWFSDKYNHVLNKTNAHMFNNYFST